MSSDRRITGRNAIAGLGLALIVATAAFGALLGATLPARTGLEEISVLTISVPVSPLTLGIYGAVAVGAVLLSLLLVVRILSRFDAEA
ncbi:DUF7520 family protein [Natrinema versiforme]|uniref:Cox cluster protein n=1 Tax=Natrinema versiforme JCM 10478 TaxID=1227496 RepID=L9Y9D5_9EURY|nr:hypothetical protein [Natrinema versiforme]ELY70276.1 hypothetical protein C489_02981 [Natrinema versiforme JCM 10478]